MNDHKLEYEPTRVWNIDETFFSIDPSKTKVVGEVNSPATRTISTSGKENITVVMGRSAHGDKLPPLIIFKGKNVWDQWIAPEGVGYPGTTYAATNQGWMETEVFENYFKNCFLPNIGQERPVLLIYDGHSSHVGLNVIQKAIENNIVILKLPPHSSDNLQPFDISVFKSLKDRWDEKLVRWQRQNVGKKLPKQLFARFVGEIWMEMEPEIIKNGFKRAGIHPYDPSVFPERLYDPAALKRWKDQKNKTDENNQHGDMSAATQQDMPSTSSSGSIAPEMPTTSSVNRPSTSTSGPLVPLPPAPNQSSDTTFVELLLNTVRGQHTPPTMKKRRVARGAEVITSDEVLERLRKEAEEKKSKEKEKEDKQKEKERRKRENSKAEIKKKKHDKEMKEPKKKRTCRQNSSDSEEEIFQLASSDDEDLIEQIEQEETFENETEALCQGPNKWKVQDWVLVKFPTKKTVKHFIGQIESISDRQEPNVRFLRKVSATSKLTIMKYPELQDMSEVVEQDIVSILPAPSLGRRGEIVFNVGFSQYNLQ